MKFILAIALTAFILCGGWMIVLAVLLFAFIFDLIGD